jgi:hypothetical protein
LSLSNTNHLSRHTAKNPVLLHVLSSHDATCCNDRPILYPAAVEDLASRPDPNIITYCDSFAGKALPPNWPARYKRMIGGNDDGTSCNQDAMTYSKATMPVENTKWVQGHRITQLNAPAVRQY